MKQDPDKIFSVITGDFIGFSDLPASVREEMYFVLKNCGAELSSAFPGMMPYELDVFRGDGWQILIADPALSLRAALYLRAGIKAHAPARHIDSRLAIGVGPIDYVPDNRVSAGDGLAFRLSGKLIEQMNSSKSGTMRFSMNGWDQTPLVDGLVRMAGVFADLWTTKQALAMTGALQGWDRRQISGLWQPSISPQAVGKHLERGNWYAIEHGVRVFEEGVGRLLSKL